MFGDKDMQKAYMEYKKHWHMPAERGWVGLKTTFPRVLAYTSKKGQAKYKPGKVGSVVTDLDTLYWLLQDPKFIKNLVTEAARKCEAGWTAVNKSRGPGTRIPVEERVIAAVQQGKDFPSFLLLVANTWHMTQDVHNSLEEPKFRKSKLRIQIKFASKAFGTRTNMKSGAMWINYGDLMALIDSVELREWLNKIHHDRDCKLNDKYLENQHRYMQSDEYALEIEEILEPAPPSDEEIADEMDEDGANPSYRPAPASSGVRGAQKEASRGGGQHKLVSALARRQNR